jgi:hypothetical protein
LAPAWRANANIVVEKIAICGPPTAREQVIVDRLRRNGASWLR